MFYLNESEDQKRELNYELPSYYGKEFLTVEEVAEYLNLKPATIYAYNSKGMIPYCKRHGQLYYHLPTIREWILEEARPTIQQQKKQGLREFRSISSSGSR